jgi:hypothetical protein
MTSIEALGAQQNIYTQSVSSSESSQAAPSTVVQNSAWSAELQPLVATPRQQAVSLSAQQTNSVVRMMEACASLVAAVVELVTAFMSSKHKEDRPVKDLPKPQPSAPADPLSTKPATTAGSTKVGLQAIQDERGQVVVRTPDGFIVRALASHEAWTITGPEGKTTRIFGDPHVFESDGTRWDFTKQATFVFGRNKATVEVVPAGNGTTLSRQVTIYSGDQRATIGGIDTNRPALLALAHDGRPHDDALSDGSIYVRRVAAGGESWTKKTTGRSFVMGA